MTQTLYIVLNDRGRAVSDPAPYAQARLIWLAWMWAGFQGYTLVEHRPNR